MSKSTSILVEIMPGQIITIFVAPSKHAEQIAVDSVQVKTGKGIVGDRFYGFRQTQRGRNLTLVEMEKITEFNQQYQQDIALNATRRNMITQGIRLNELVGKQFYIGDVLCEGVELCEPCGVMVRSLACAGLSKTQVMNAFAHKAGIRVEVLSDGIVNIGDDVSLGNWVLSTHSLL